MGWGVPSHGPSPVPTEADREDPSGLRPARCGSLGWACRGLSRSPRPGLVGSGQAAARPRGPRVRPGLLHPGQATSPLRGPGRAPGVCRSPRRSSLAKRTQPPRQIRQTDEPLPPTKPGPRPPEEDQRWVKSFIWFIKFRAPRPCPEENGKRRALLLGCSSAWGSAEAGGDPWAGIQTNSQVWRPGERRGHHHR